MGVINFFTMPRKRARKLAHKLADQSFFYDMEKYLIICLFKFLKVYNTYAFLPQVAYFCILNTVYRCFGIMVGNVYIFDIN